MLVRFCRCWLVGFFHGQPADRTRSGQHHAAPGAAAAPPGVPAVLAGMRCDAGELAETLWAARGPDELMDTYAEIEALKCALDALALDVVRELDATDAVKQVGGPRPRTSSPRSQAATRGPAQQSCVSLG